MTYISDKEKGIAPKLKTEIDGNVWAAIFSRIQNLLDDGSLGRKFPYTCPDGSDVCGTDFTSFWRVVRGEIPDLANIQKEQNSWLSSSDQGDVQWPPIAESVPETLPILDLIQFVTRYTAKSIQGEYHSYFKHHHLSFDEETGKQEFTTDINRLFSRNGLAFELTEEGEIKRLVYGPIAKIIKNTEFSTGDSETDKLLDRAVKLFLSPKPDDQQDALEKIWDAFERIKTLESGTNKKDKSEKLLKKACGDIGPVFEKHLEKEFGALTKIGNLLRIRHSEVGKETVSHGKQAEYLFARMFSVLVFVLRGTDRTS